MAIAWLFCKRPCPVDACGRPASRRRLDGLGGLLDREMQQILVEMSFDGSLFRLEGQEHGSIGSIIAACHCFSSFALTPPRARKSGISAYLINTTIYEARQERISEADLMSGKYPLSFLRRIERQRLGRIKTLRQVHGQIVVAIKRILQHLFDNNGPLIPVPVRTAVGRRRLDQRRSHD
jgi:hypothetical protein